MKNPRSKMLTSFHTAVALAGLCMVEAAGAEAGAVAETPAAAEARKRAPASNFLPIVRGRLPLLFVHAVRFDKVLNAMGNKDLATKLATSVGKIFDIKKNKNFAYVNETYKPSAEDISAAEAWITQVGAANAKGVAATGDKSLMEKIVADYKGRGLATAEEVAALSAARTVVRKASAPAEGKAATPAATGEAVQVAAAGSADDLLG